MLTVGGLKYFLKVIDSSHDLKKYESNEMSIRGLIKYCYDRYESFCPEKDKEIEAALPKTQAQQMQQDIPQRQLINSSNGVKAFTLKKGNIDAFSLILFKHLTESSLIANETDLDSFRKAFDGTIQQRPLKIKWIDKGRNGKSNKHTLIYLLDKLVSCHSFYDV